MAGKGDKRRFEDREAVRKNWPFADPESVYKKHREHIERKNKGDK